MADPLDDFDDYADDFLDMDEKSPKASEEKGSPGLQKGLPEGDEKKGSWKGLWQESLEQMSNASSGGNLSAAGSASSMSKKSGPKDAYIRTPGGGRTKLAVPVKSGNQREKDGNQRGSTRQSEATASPGRKNVGNRGARVIEPIPPRSRLSGAGERKAPLPSGRSSAGAVRSGSVAKPRSLSAKAGGGGEIVKTDKGKRPQSFPNDDDCDLGMTMHMDGDEAVSRRPREAVQWDRQKLMREMVALPRSKKEYLLKMLEGMERELREAAGEVQPASRRKAIKTKEEDPGKVPKPPQPSPQGWGGDACTNIPPEVLKVWAKVQKMRPYHRPVQPYRPPSPQHLQKKPREAGKEAPRSDQMVGPTGLREHIVRDFDVRLYATEVASLFNFFLPPQDKSQQAKSKAHEVVDYREVSAFLRRHSLPGGIEYRPSRGGQESSEGQSRIRRPIYQEEAARTVLSMPPPDSNSRALLEKLADVAARTSKHEVGNIFRTEERRPILVPVHEFKALLSTALDLRVNTTEFDLLLQWFGNGLLDKSAAVDLGLFSQQFWALGCAAKTRRRKEESQNRFISSLSGSLRKGQSVEAGMDEPISITHQPPQSGHIKQPHKHATPASPTYSTDWYDEESFEDEKSVHSRHR